MIVTRALYGGVSVLDKVKDLIKNNRLYITPSNQLFGDTNPNNVKYLELTINGLDYRVKENESFRFPKNPIVLGVFYTNNQHKAAQFCLKDLYKFKQGGSSFIDIIACSWNRINNHPFLEIEAIHKVNSHLNIVLQILQVLYYAQKRRGYQYVAFLEHDVLYPDDYLIFEEFDPGTAIVNMNYIGICEDGFQNRNQDDQPMHQIIMTFEDAIRHFNSLLQMLLAGEFKVLEPNNMNLINRFCDNPAIHINYTNHFTSHYNIYSKNNTYTSHTYWGRSDELWSKIFCG